MVATLLSFNLSALHPEIAAADDGDDCGEYSLFVQKENFNAYGAKANIVSLNHAIACNGPVAQTQIIIFTTDRSNFLEIGYRQEFTTSMKHRIFGEWGFYPSQTGGPFFYGDVTPDGSAPRYKITNVPLTFSWNLYQDPNGGENYGTRLAQFQNMWGQKGWALWEVSKYGSSGTADAANEEFNMQFKGSGGNWNDYANLLCPGDVGYDTLQGWKAHTVIQYTDLESVHQVGYCFG